MKILYWFLLGIILLTSILFFGCTTPQETVIKIGYIGPLTGDAASVGEAGLAAAELAVKEINDAGGLLNKKIELVVEDDQCTTTGGTNAINKLLNIDQVIAISGPDCGSAAGSSLPLAQQAGTPVVIRWASVPDLPKIGNYIFRVYPSDTFQGVYTANYIFNALGKKRVAVLYVKNEYGQGLRDVFVEEFTRLGGEIVFEDSFTQDASDLRSIITKAKEANPDIVFFPAYRAAGIIGLRQMKELGLNVPIVAGDAFDTDEVIKNPEGEGVLYSVAITNNPKEFKQRVLEATGKKADKITAPLAYDSIYIIAEAIQRAGNLDKEKIRAELENTSFAGVSYELIEFDENGDLKGAEYEMRIIQNQKSVKYEK
ncbi:ABC transporter substrate-binding protein [Candidatus Micrarchaeota archaeon]|nr:ABC transporter substrate-binding protein [Candidatus Micrarchaeota archaeon]MBU1930486.1 ABC transporter substrate-binding protein [Candidatus Micrarchaeota archaeon]